MEPRRARRSRIKRRNKGKWLLDGEIPDLSVVSVGSVVPWKRGDGTTEGTQLTEGKQGEGWWKAISDKGGWLPYGVVWLGGVAKARAPAPLFRAVSQWSLCALWFLGFNRLGAFRRICVGLYGGSPVPVVAKLARLP
jgi:hypothetical protein